MAAVSDKELDQLRERNEKLRERKLSAEAKQAENEAQRQREYEAKQLEAENARLEAEVLRAEQLAKVGASKEGAAGLLANADEQLEAAKALLEAPVGPVDTNAGNGDENEKGGN